MFNQKSKKRSLEKLRLQSVSSDREKNPAEGSTQQRGAPSRGEHPLFLQLGSLLIRDGKKKGHRLRCGSWPGKGLKIPALGRKLLLLSGGAK